MKRVLKISAWLLGLLFLLILAGLVAIQSPRVQTFLAEQVVAQLQDRIDADLDIGLVTLRPFDAVVLHDIVMKDPAPVVGGMDTVACIKNLTVKFNLMGLFRDSGVHVRRLKLDGGVFNLSVEPDMDSPNGSTMNMYRVLGIASEQSDKGPAHWGNLLSAKFVEVSNFTFRYASVSNALAMFSEGSFFSAESINWNDFTVHVEDLVAGDVAVKDDLIIGQVQGLVAEDTASGFRIDMASARRVQVSRQNVTVNGFHLQSGNTDAHLSLFTMDGPLADYADFTDKIRLSAQIADGSVISMPTLRHFADGLGDLSFEGRIGGQVSGTVRDLRLEALRIEDTQHPVRLSGRGRITGLPEIDDTYFDIRLDELQFTMAGLRQGVVPRHGPGPLPHSPRRTVPLLGRACRHPGQTAREGRHPLPYRPGPGRCHPAECLGAKRSHHPGRRNQDGGPASGKTAGYAFAGTAHDAHRP